ncbi:MAG: translation initiation factor IF-2 [Candidatus Moranbacteria bacterium CG_4_8_14_3_um_filter_34_16]|nr:MAG: translation initiation factor IF-2 [Candidatus Moranbacteria bacterium CG08_land_8_20_14_0_20_34_16]PIW95402.1 MAG: translation initiation factor IF-2 [Candidatus Moranbacteria bacterium CG_4_8_14_3_um_filter_34_16]PJA89445.1 MAG: translation initiation factor IF-2 [Candidatus Moranbacteria bacterium CG_4_9_14_3_um_filter_33_15]
MSEFDSKKAEEKKVKIPSSLTVKKFGGILALPVNVVITELMKNGVMATINEKIDFETASIIAQDLHYEVAEDMEEFSEEMTLKKLNDLLKQEKKSGENLKDRPPIVTILGHVDHGKTTLLDTIRKTNVAGKESGGITQHINAYQVKKKGKVITFVDTPGHAAFSAMRERGVSLADIAVLVVAADDGVRPQTKEVIAYLLEKKIPTVVAINKIDKPGVNVKKVKQELADNGILLEEWGGEVLSSKISAKQNIGIDGLLDNILLLAEVEDYKANFSRDPLGVVLESHLDSQMGPVASVLVKTGTLKEGQDIFAGKVFGRVRRIENFKGEKIKEAFPSMPVSVIGFHEAPEVNDIVRILVKKSGVKSKIHDQHFENSFGSGVFSSQDIIKSITNEKIKKLNIILKADVQGSLEAIGQILNSIKSEEVAVDFIASGVGNITESDVRLAGNSQAIVYGFNVEITSVAKRMAENGKVEIKKYKVIYELVEDIKRKLSDMLPSSIEREDFGKMKVLAIFKTGKGDMIVGGKVVSGKMVNGSLIEVKRGEKTIGKGRLENLQENKVNVNEVSQNKECGITFLGDTKIKNDDLLLSYKEEIKKRQL